MIYAHIFNHCSDIVVWFLKAFKEKLRTEFDTFSPGMQGVLVVWTISIFYLFLRRITPDWLESESIWNLMESVISNLKFKENKLWWWWGKIQKRENSRVKFLYFHNIHIIYFIYLVCTSFKKTYLLDLDEISFRSPSLWPNPVVIQIWKCFPFLWLSRPFFRTKK